MSVDNKAMISKKKHQLLRYYQLMDTIIRE